MVESDSTDSRGVDEPMTLPLSKGYDPADFPALAEELVTVDREFGSATDQHALRRWEYAMAIRAIDQYGAPSGNSHLVDVGGAGSPFWKMVPAYHSQVVDPAENTTLADYLRRNPRLANIVTCLSVIEHVPDLEEFLYHLSCLTAPGGLLFLTMDYAFTPPAKGQAFPADPYMFHWMRARIFDAVSVSNQVYMTLAELGFHLLGPRDFDSGVAFENWGYSAYSLALVKRS